MSKERAPGFETAGGEVSHSIPGLGGFLSTIAIVVGTGAVVLGVVASASSAPILLTLLSVLAMLGVFFLFALAAGHIRIGERLPQGELLKFVADRSTEGVIVTNRSGQAVYANSAVEILFGGPVASGLTALEAQLRASATASSALFRLTRAAERGELRAEEFEVPARAPVALGQPASRTLSVEVRPFEIPGHDRDVGPLTYWRVADVTAARAREAASVAAYETRLERFDQAPVGLATADATGLLGTVNRAFTEWLGTTPEKAQSLGLGLRDILPADGAELLAAVLRQSGGEAKQCDLDLVREDGRLVPVRVLARARSQGGLDLAAISREFAGPVTGGTPGGEEQFSRLFQSAPFGIATVSASGKISGANAAFARMILDGSSGLNSDAIEILGRGADVEAKSQIGAGLKSVLSGRGNVAPVEISAGAQNEFTRRVFMSPLTQTPDAREAAVLYVIDATEQKALEAKFAQSQKMEAVGKLAGGIAHDFNNVLTGIIGHSDLLLQTHRQGDPAHKDIKNIRASADRAAGLVRQLLGFSRRQTQQVEILNLGEVLSEWSPTLKTTVGEKIDLKFETGRDLWYVKADKTQFDQVIVNLVVNARDAMANGGRITVATRNLSEREAQKLTHLGFTVGEYVLVEVSDTGSGMSQDVMDKIFEPFFTTKGVGKGTGLGLATVYGIIKQSGGFIFPASEIGKGTTFRIYLPRHEPENEAEVAAAKAPKKEIRTADLTGTGRVLLVEDEDIVRSFAVRALRRQGYEVLEAADGKEALEVMAKAEGKVDIVVSDVVMPEMDGPALLKELRKKNPEIKIIFVSGYPNEAFREQLGNEEFAFLPKPFSLPQLAQKVKEELAR